MKKLDEKKLTFFIGKDFIHGTQDCYALIRDFYQVAFNIKLTNYARPDYWWNYNMDLYSDLFFREGFRTVEIARPRDLQYGDIILMAIKSTQPCHAGIYVDDGKILHHFYGRKSSIELYKSLWYNATTSVIRHKDVVIDTTYVKKDLIEDERIRYQLLLLQQRARERGNNSQE